jgi:hypothetical protein
MAALSGVLVDLIIVNQRRAISVSYLNTPDFLEFVWPDYRFLEVINPTVTFRAQKAWPV